MTTSRGFVDWLAAQDVSLAISTYQTGKLFLVGRSDEGRLSVYERTFERGMGLAGDDQTIYMATLFQLWRLENMLQPDETLDGYDRYYARTKGSGLIDVDALARDFLGSLGQVRFVDVLDSRQSCRDCSTER